MGTNSLNGSQAKGQNAQGQNGQGGSSLGGSQARGNNPLSGSQAKAVSFSNQEMKERVISEKVVSERVLGSSNPLARFGRKAGSQISSRIGGVLVGLVLIIISLVVVWKSENLVKSSAVVKSLPLIQAEQAVGKTGLVKVQGRVNSMPISSPKDPRQLLYYHQTREELEMVKSTEIETKVVTQNGQDVEQTIEKEVEKPEWVSKFDEAKWAPIVLADKITVNNPANAQAKLNLTSIFSDTQEKVREEVRGVLATENLIVIGEINNNVIDGGQPFIISNQSDSALIASLESSENIIWWLYKLATALLFGIGLYLLLGPVLLLLDIIPILGNLGKGIILIASLLIGVLFTLFSSLIINYWYIVLIIIIAVVIYLFTARKPKAQPQN